MEQETRSSKAGRQSGGAREAAGDLIAVKADLERSVRLRKKQLQLLVDISMMANEARGIEDALEYALRRIAEYNGWSFGHAYLLDDEDEETIVSVSTYYSSDASRFRAFRETTRQAYLRRGQGLPGRVLASGRYEWTDDIAEDLSARRGQVGDLLGLVSAFAFPILTGSKVVGVMEFFSDRTHRLDAAAQAPIASIGAQLGRVIERENAKWQLLELADRERARISRDLHDSVGQELAGLAMSADAVVRRLESAGSSEAGSVAALAAGLRHALDETRQIAHRLNKLPSGRGALHGALRELATRVTEQSGIKCTIESEPEVAVDDEEIATHLYRIAQEAIQNALKHSGSKTVAVRLSSLQQGTVLEIRDEGDGLPDAIDENGMGLRIMRQRAHLLGGRLDIEAGEVRGTVVRCVIPHRPDRATPGA